MESSVRKPSSLVTKSESSETDKFLTHAPQISLPKGGGAIRGIGEKFSANPVTGTGSMSVPIATSPGRGGFGPQLALSYDSGAGNGPFGLGWNLSLPAITRKTDKGLPKYFDAEESDVFILAGAEDLVPVLDDTTGTRLVLPPVTIGPKQYVIHRYRPRVEGMFALIERWSEPDKQDTTFWRTISRDNVTTWYGRDDASRIVDPADPTRIFQWLICQTHDDKGNVAVYDYLAEDDQGIDITTAQEANRNTNRDLRIANRYPQRIRYGNVKPYLPDLTSAAAWPSPDAVPDQKWMFEVVFDYGQCKQVDPSPNDREQWPVRADPFSSYRSGFEVRTYRLCQRVLMFHHFEELRRDSEQDILKVPIPNYLVRSTVFSYVEPDMLSNPAIAGYTVLQSISHWSHQWLADPAPAKSRYEFRQLPPVEFSYSQSIVDTALHTLDPAELENLPVGTQGSGYQWVDLDGEGLSGVLTEQGGAWHYKPSYGDGSFGPMRVVARKPAMAALAAGRQQLLDLAGDGEIDLVDFSGPTPGFHERDIDEGWKRHVPFAYLPNIDWADPNLRFIDLTGDGHADVLITDQNVFTWYQSLDVKGFGPAERTYQPFDEEAGPRLVFADGTQTIFLADMSGDGLTDLARIRNGEVCYWPNLGYGKFGARVTLDNSPVFDHPELYDPHRIRLADIDGSGPVDLIYLGRDGARLYFNRSGNSLSDPQPVPLPIATENLAAVQVADLLGNGTACLVWNSHLPADARNPVRYINLMGGANESPEVHRYHEKPHLLTKVINNLGGSTEIEYTPSTRFYIADKLAGTPWITRLPFPVHCVSKVTVSDKWRGTSFSSTTSYHHGCFDGIEREFRGFGRVEQLDVESYDHSTTNNLGSPWVTADHTLYQPPVKSITWYHTGAALDRQRILNQFAHEYFPQRYAARLSDIEKPLPEPELPADLDADEWREALRACKGMVLRQEVYELDVKDLAAPSPRHTPVYLFSAATHNCNIQRIQPRGENLHAVFLVTESEALSYHYELDLRGADRLTPDPRIAHTLNLRHDEYGNPQQSAAIGYGRLQPGDYSGLPRPELIAQVQGERHLAYTETHYTAALPDDPHRHRLPVPCEVLTYELSGADATTGFVPSVAPYFSVEDMRAFALSDTLPDQGSRPVALLQYHEQPKDESAHKRIFEWVRMRFFKDDLSGPEDFGKNAWLGLLYETYKLALTDELLNAVFKQTDATGTIDDKLAWEVKPGKTARDLLDEPASAGLPYLTTGYIQGTAIDPVLAGQYWMRSGVAGFAADAKDHFYLPEEYTDPFDNKTSLLYDGSYDLFIKSSTDAMGNVVAIADDNQGNPRFDYRVLAPIEMVDANGNRSEVAFDVLGLVVAAAVKGKNLSTNPAVEKWEGDNLAGFDFVLTNPPQADVTEFCTSDPVDRAQAAKCLANASSRFVYHFGDVGGQWVQRPPGACGIVREQHVGQLAAGTTSPLQIALECSDGTGNVLMKKIQAEPDPTTGNERWIVNGLTILNNKGKPVKQYEPAFSATFGCEMPTENGVSTTTYYDAVGRVVRVDMPDGTFSRVEFSPWHSRSYDQNDTAYDPNPLHQNHSDWYLRRTDPTHPLFAQFNMAENRRAAKLVEYHADTPALTIVNSLGRDVIAIAHNRAPSNDPAFSNTALLDRPWLDQYTLTFTKLDAEGKPLWICDARGNLVMQYITPAKHNHTALYDAPNPDWRSAYDMPTDSSPCYDIAGNLLYQHSMDAGERWMLMDAAGKPMLAWDLSDKGAGTSTQKRIYRTEYDALHRPTAQWLKLDATNPEQVEAFEYLDSQGLSASALKSAQGSNLIGQAIKHWDPSGLATVERIDLSGKPAHITRTLIKPDADGGTGMVDWSADRATPLDSETFNQITAFDALGRMTTLYNWHRAVPDRVAVYVPTYNERGLLKSETLDVSARKTLDGHTPSATGPVAAITETGYNAKGQKLTQTLGNGTTTRYSYDDRTFRLAHLYTRRDNAAFTGDCAGDPSVPQPARPCGMQNLHYTYDPIGNITHIQDDAQQTIYFKNAAVEPSNDYTYDALYRLIEATGRENSQAPSPPKNYEGSWLPGSFPSSDQPCNYMQRYRYDEVGNFVEMKHTLSAASGWTRGYETQPDSNRLYRTWYNAPDFDHAAPDRRVEYRHDAHGNMLNLNQTPDDWGLDIQWDWRDMISRFDAIGGGIARYHYGIDKQRTRKHITRSGAGVVEDRIYLGGYELYRRYLPADMSTPVEEIESLHLFEGEQRVLLVDDVIDTDRTHADGTPYKKEPIFRYQYGNQLGSVGLELDDQAQIISYEEFHPYGTSAYRLMDTAKEVPPKRYRYTGMERDDESGLSYHLARSYAPWIARWLAPDPTGIGNDVNLYTYAKSTPLRLLDKNGRQGIPGNFDPRYIMAQGFGQITEYLYGGETAITRENGEVNAKYNISRGGVGGLFGGALRTVSLRIIPGEDYPTPYGKSGAEAGANIIPILDPAERLVSGKTVTGDDASRLAAAAQLTIEVLPFLPELIAGLRAEAKLAQLRLSIKELKMKMNADELDPKILKQHPYVFTSREKSPLISGAMDVDSPNDLGVSLNLQPSGVKIDPVYTPGSPNIFQQELDQFTETLEPVLRDRTRTKIADLRARFEAGTISQKELAAGLAGTHSEVKATDNVLKLRKARLGREMTEDDLGRIVTYNLSTDASRLDNPVRCPNCAAILKGVQETTDSPIWNSVKSFFGFGRP